MRHVLLLGVLACVPAGAETSVCALPIGATLAGPAEARAVVAEADRRFRWSAQLVEALREELRSLSSSSSGRPARDHRSLLASLVNSSTRLWLRSKEAACACLPDAATARCSDTLPADRERLLGLLPRSSLRRPPDVDRLTKGR